jgi:hypothetical protein
MICESTNINPVSGSKLSRALRGKQYILCIDEVRFLANPSFFTGRAINQLSGLSDGPDEPFILIVSSREPLEVVFPEKLPQCNSVFQYTSTFSSLFLSVNIDAFTKKNLEDFISKKMYGLDVDFNESHLEEIWNVSNGNPRKIQEVARRIFREIVIERG